jgi:hypothetical protein
MQVVCDAQERSERHMSETRIRRATRRATAAATQTIVDEFQPEPAPKWGELPPPERIAALEARLAKWEQLPAEARGDPGKGEGRSAFDSKGPHARRGALTGADVFYLAARVLADSAEPGAVEAAAARLREGFPWGLSALHLDGAELVGARLEGAILPYAHLEGASLHGVHLEGAILTGAHLEGTDTDLTRAHLEGANLRGTHLERTILGGAYLEGANLFESHLETLYVNPSLAIA